MVQVLGRGAVAALLSLTAVTHASAQAGPPLGKYECWASGRPALTLAFTLQAGGRYADFEGKAGTWRLAADAGVVTFSGGALDGQRTLFKASPRPTLTFAKPDGSFALGVACDHAG